MKRKIFMFIMTFLMLFSFFAKGNKIVIAHRGACGYLPEHSIAAKAMAYGMGADYIEQDLVMTKDNRIVVLHDHYLDRVTNVAKKFPARKRDDGRYYVIDFTLAEIKTLEMTEGFNIKDGKEVANFSERFPLWKSTFRVHTFEEEIELIQGLNKSTNKNIGIYPEIKSPWFHKYEGKDISKEVVRILKQYGYTKKSDKVFLQCFDPDELKRIHDELLKENKMDINLVQLMAETSWNETMVVNGDKFEPYNYDWMFQEGAMKRIAVYADGVGPWKPMLVKDGSTKRKLIITDIVSQAHKNGLVVHPYTFRLDKGRIPEYAKNFEDMVEIFFKKVKVDGIFTDFPDRAVELVKKKKL